MSKRGKRGVASCSKKCGEKDYVIDFNENNQPVGENFTWFMSNYALKCKQLLPYYLNTKDIPQDVIEETWLQIKICVEKEMIKDGTYNKGIEDPLSRVFGPEHGGRTRTVSNVIGKTKVKGGLFNIGKNRKTSVPSVGERVEKSPVFHGSNVTSGRQYNSYPPIEKLTPCELLFPFQPSLEFVVAKGQAWPSLDRTLHGRLINENCVKVDTIVQQQHQVGPMGFVDMIEQGDQIPLQETQVASTSVPKIPSPKFVDPEIDIALAKIKKRTQAIQSISKMLADYVGDEHAIICNSPDGMYAETYEECLSYVELLQLFCNDWLDVTIIHLFAIKMWIIMLVMMVFTRTRSDENSQPPAYQSVPEGSASAGTKRRRNHKSRKSRPAEETDPEVQHATEQPVAEIPTGEQRADQPKRRGPNINQSVARTLHNLPEGTKIPLTMDKQTKNFVGTSATKFATECGIIIRNVCPMNFHTWDSVPKEVKTLMYEKLEKYSDKMEENRAKQVNTSRGGSRSISNHVYQMINPKTQMPPSPLQVYYKLHFNAKKQGWLNDHARIEYENIIEHKKAAVNELTLKGTVITTAIEHNLEKEAIQSVCDKQKTLQSAWEIGVGQVLRKKDSWMMTSVQSSQQDSSHTNEDLENQVIALKKKLEDSNEKYQRMSEFISTKFPEFENIISTPMTDEAHDSEGLSGDSYHTT
ncbi:hypothetical protein R6Q57_005374 [Mikania cordata]